jgi:phytoene synthase
MGTPMSTPAALDRSFRYCRHIARSRAKNFYYSFVLLRGEQRDAMCAIYAFMRYCDDLSDEPGASRAAIDRWRASLDEALAGRVDGHAVWPAFRHTVETYRIPHRYFHEMIDGVASDLEPRRISTFDELYRYCYQVASVVGLTTIHIFGFESEKAKPLAEKCGVAFQLTNILRDIREDADRGRIYLPLEDLANYGVTEKEMIEGVRSERMRNLLKFEAGRARRYYEDSAPLVGMVEKRSRKSLWALIRIYSSLLDRIEQSDYDVFSKRISLSTLDKLGIVLRSLKVRNL